ncbi:hypothetical protein ASG65_19090 [Bacillus sp. Leaf13]|nr:hypothetical protein ASG65_19090 [Bacillus sp. Leaf13]
MRIRRRIQNVEKLLPLAKQGNNEELERVIEWLVESCEEFRECVRQLYRLKCKVGQNVDNWLQLDEKYKVLAATYYNRINELIEEHKACILQN